MASLAQLTNELEPELARQVFTHSSWAPERTLSYERLEFLGDSVLGLCISTDIYSRYPEYNEGELAKVRAYVVSRHTCAKVGEQLDLSRKLIEAAKQADAANITSLAANANVLAAMVEALIGALYLQFGMEVVLGAVLEVFNEHIEYAASEHIDFKTELQEEAARRNLEVNYEVVAVEGPPHSRMFTSEVSIGGRVMGSGRGRTKKVSQQGAAKEALNALRVRGEADS
ncbi:ribonuclease 3 [bacterium BMS3Abin01]|nr:ribonuclease 3 [bacterium BMS3Abin01]HDZ59244.1 ribonuclease III [Actinomycetota bacterium]